MDYYCDVCDRSINVKSETKHPKNLTHNELEKSIRTKHTIQNQKFFDIDELFNEYVHCHKKNRIIYL